MLLAMLLQLWQSLGLPSLYQLVCPNFYRTLLGILQGHSLGSRPITCLVKNFRSWVHLSKSCKKLQNSDFQSQFSVWKIIWIFLNYFFIEGYHFWSTFFVINILLKTSFFKTLYILKWGSIFDNFHSTDRKTENFVMGWLLVLGLKEWLVKCVTVCDKSVFILLLVIQ